MNDEQKWKNDAAVFAFEDAVGQGLLNGYEAEDPFVCALTWMLSILDTPLNEDRVFRAIPHAPPTLAVEDIRNTLCHLGADTELVPVTRATWRAAKGPHLALDHKGSPFLRADASVRPLDPVTADAGPAHRRAYAHLLVLKPKPEMGRGSWINEQLRFQKKDILRLLLVKAASVFVSLAIALGVVAVYQWVLPTQAFGTLAGLAVGLLCVLVADYGFLILKARVLGEIAERAEYVLSASLVERVLGMPLEKVTAATPAQQSARLRQLMSASSTFSGSALDVILDLPFAALLLAGVAYVAPPLALVPLGLAVLLFAIGLLALPELRRREVAASSARAEAGHAVDEVVRDRRQIQADGREGLVFGRSVEAVREAVGAVQKHEALQRGLESAASAAGPLAGGLLAVLGALMVINEQIGVGLLLATVILSWRILAPIQSASQLVLRLSELFENRRAINAMMDIEAENDPLDSPLEGINGRSLAVDGLICRYPGAGEAALKGLSFEIPQGALVAVTGAAGAGKTTLLRAVSGLTPPVGGRVVVGGLNTEQIPVGLLRGSVAYVPSRPHILHGTIAQNLRLRTPGAYEWMLRTVCENLGILGAIEALPDGFGTRVTTQVQGSLPRGFMQSLAIARAVIDAPDALLLDEPAVGMDADLESSLLRTLEKIRGKHTVLMVTHRPSHIRACDLELRLERGQLQSFDQPEGKAA